MSTSTTTAVSAPPDDPMLEGPPKRSQLPNRWFLASDTVHKATEGMPEYEQDNIRWLQRYAASGNHPPSSIASQLRKPNGEAYSQATVYQVLTGRRTEQGVSVRTFAEAIASMRRRISETESARSTAFVETSTTRKIFAMCRQCVTKQRIGFLFGPPQTGKTSALTEYSRCYNHGETHLVRMPTRGALTHFLSELAAKVQVPTQRREDELRRRILDCFDERTLLVVDEAHQCLMGRGESGAMTLEFIREIHDRRKCGVVICGTQVLQDNLQHNKVLRQLWLRRAPGLVLNLTTAGVSESELDQFAASFGLDPAPTTRMRVRYRIFGADGNPIDKSFPEVPSELQKRIIATDGLGAWCKLLEDARDLPGERMTWGKVITAYCLATSAEMSTADSSATGPAPATDGSNGGAA